MYIISQAGSTPVLSLLGGLPKAEKPERPFVNESNIIMYLDMVNEKGVELKGIAQFVDAQAKAKTEKKDFLDSKLTVGLGGLLGNVFPHNAHSFLEWFWSGFPLIFCR